MSILVVGSVAIDSVRTPFGSRKGVLGGSATYFSMAASFFDKVDIVATVGRDFPSRYVGLFRTKGIGTDGLRQANGKTFRWKGWYGYDLSTANTVYTHLNVFKDFRPEVPAALRGSRHVFLANIDPELQLLVLGQITKPKLIACDSMNYWIENKKKHLLKLLKHVDIFLLNEGEVRQLTGEANLLKAARSALSYGPGAVVIKRGEHGVIYFSRSCHFISPAYLLEQVRDPTGAGDTFAGGMIGYLGRAGCADRTSVCRGIIYGNILASFTVEDFSVNRLANITWRDIKKRYDRFRTITRF